MRRLLILAAAVATLCAGLAGCGGGEKINAPFESMDYKGKSLEGIVSELEGAGFTNIQTEPQTTENEYNADNVIAVKIGSHTSWNTANAWKADVPIIIEYYEYTGIRHFEVTADIAVSGEDGKPVFTVQTNLPDGTVFSTELSSTEDGTSYFEQRAITVQGGTAQTEAFTLDGGPLVGAYTFGVVMLPAEQTESVQEVTGETGEAMRGDLVEKNGSYNYVAASVEYISPVGASIKKISEEELQERFKEALSGFGNDCEISVDRTSYTVNVWQDGLAKTATLAKSGDEEAKREWDKIVYATMKASDSLQEILTLSGYGDCMVQVQVLNDENHDNTLLTTCLGMATYNCVP